MTFDEAKKKYGIGGSGGYAYGGGSVGVTTPSYSPVSSAQSQYQAAMDKANAANESRYTEGKAKMTAAEAEADKIGTGQLAALEQTKKQDVAAGMQSLVGSGMGNTTVAASLPQAWESNVGTTGRLQIGESAAYAKMIAFGNTAGFIERRTDQAPDMGQYATLTSQAAMGNPNTQSYTPSPVSTPASSVSPMPTPQTGNPNLAPPPAGSKQGEGSWINGKWIPRGGTGNKKQQNSIGFM